MTVRTKSKYAEGTKVAVEQTLAAIRAMIQHAARTAKQPFEWNEGVRADATRWVEFKLHGAWVRLAVTPPTEKEVTGGRWWERERIQAALAQETRRRWRVLIRLLEAKLIAVEEHGASFEQEFLAYIILPDARTVGESMVPHLQRLLAAPEEAATLPLLPEPESKNGRA